MSNSDQTQSSAAQPQPTATITGILQWVSGYLKDGTKREIAIRMDGETAPSLDAGFDTPLRGVTLTKSATKAFDEALDEEILRKKPVVIIVRTPDLAADLAAGFGLKDKDYLVGVSVKPR